MALNFAYEVSVTLRKDIYHALKCQDMGPTALLPPQRSRATHFVALRNPSLYARFEPSNLGANGKDPPLIALFIEIRMVSILIFLMMQMGGF
jgi:hypothetical protein